MGPGWKEFRESVATFSTWSFLPGASVACDTVSGSATLVHRGRYPLQEGKSAGIAAYGCRLTQQDLGLLVQVAAMPWDG